MILLTLFLSLLSSATEPADNADIQGLWRFDSVIYEGERRPPFNEDLMIHFKFTDSGESLLHWTRKGEKGFCERRARYRYDGEYLWQKVTWVNPNNRIDCGSDPDMKPDRESSTPTSIIEGELRIKLGLGGEDLYYVWKKAEGPWPGEAQPN